MNEEFTITEGTDKLVIESKPEVTYSDFITFSCPICEETIYGADATFDLSDIPQQFHHLVVGALSGINYVNVVGHPECYREEARKEREKPTPRWWQIWK